MTIIASKRLWELDIIRFIALICMMIQHSVIIWLYIFAGGLVEYSEMISRIGRMGALLFLFLVGFSGYISYTKRSVRNDFTALQKHFMFRGLTVLAWGVVVSVASFMVIPSDAIWFGVLSFIGMAIITLPFFIRYKWLSISMIFISLVIGATTPFVKVNTLMWLPLGVQPWPFYSLDYWPYFPWISLVLSGVEVARALNTSPKFGTLLFSDDMPTVLRPVQWMGSHTLALYLLHVPIIAGFFWILQRLSASIK